MNTNTYNSQERVNLLEKYHNCKDDLDYLKEFISLIADSIQEDIFFRYPEWADAAEVKARDIWPQIKEICEIGEQK